MKLGQATSMSTIDFAESGQKKRNYLLSFYGYYISINLPKI